MNIRHKTIQRIESIEGRGVAESLMDLYVQKMFTYRMLCARWKLQPRQVINLMREYNIPVRVGGEAVKTQWINNPERRKKTSDRCGKFFKEFYKENSHPRTGKKMPEMAEKLKISSSFNIPEVIQKAQKSRIAFYKANPEKYMLSKAKPTIYEQMVIDSIHEETKHNHYVPHHWIDVFCPKTNIGIEVFKSVRLPMTFDRFNQITKCIDVVYLSNRVIGKFDLNNLIVNKKIFSHYPSSFSKKTVVIGAKNKPFVDFDHSHGSIEVINVNGVYILFFSTSANDLRIWLNGINSDPSFWS